VHAADANSRIGFSAVIIGGVVRLRFRFNLSRRHRTLLKGRRHRDFGIGFAMHITSNYGRLPKGRSQGGGIEIGQSTSRREVAPYTSNVCDTLFLCMTCLQGW